MGVDSRKGIWMVAALPLFLAVGAIAPASPVDLAGRVVPFEVTQDAQLSGTTVLAAPVSAGQTLDVRFRLTADEASRTYAVLAPECDETVSLEINGAPVETQPLGRGADQLFLIDPSYLAAGENTLSLRKAAAGSWSGAALFSLRPGYEEAHFASAFYEPPAGEAGSANLAPREIPTSAMQNLYDVQWYDCTWKPSMTPGTTTMLAGSQVIMGATSLVNNLQQVELDFDMNVSGNGGSPMTLDYVDSGPATPAMTTSYNSSTYRLTVNLPAPVNAGQNFVIRIGYHGAPNNAAPNELFGQDAFQVRSHGSPARLVAYSVSQPYGGRRWWPSKDHPSDKATTTVQRIVVRNDLGYPLKAVSNGVLEATTTQGNETTYVWRNDQPIATYLMSLAVSNYDYYGGIYTSQNGLETMPVGHWIYPEKASIESAGYIGTLQVMNFFAQKFGEYPFLDQKYETATWNVGWAIEHQTCTSMPSGSSAGVGNGTTSRNIHELSHQWFGDKVTCADWDHIWLHEGMAQYAVGLFRESTGGLSALKSYMASLSPSSTTPVVGPTSDQFQGQVIYDRGAWIMHMLRHVMGDDNFFAGCRAYLGTGYTTAVTQPPGKPVDFQSKMEEGGGLAPGALAQFFTQWIYSPNANYRWRPDYSFSAAYKPSAQSTTINLAQWQGGTAFQMPVDIRLTAADNQTTTVRVPAGSNSLTVPMGAFVPVTAELDPDQWILRGLRANINTASLPAGVVGQLYAATLQASASSGSFTWQKVSGPGWLSISSGGAVSGLPPAPGTYSITVRVSNNGATQDAAFELVVQPSGAPVPKVLINELLYENSQNSADGTDNDEFVELYNADSTAADISGWSLTVVDAGGNAASVVTIPGGTVLAPGAYYVLGNSATLGGVVNLNTGWLESLPDGSPGGVILKTGTGQYADSVAWRADNPFGAGAQATFASAKGGVGRLISAAFANTAENVTLGRLPNGIDTGENILDFAAVYPSPGAANAGISLPFTDSFDPAPSSLWRPAWQNPVRSVVLGTSGKPPVPGSGPAGRALEVYDSTGGGDVVFLPGAFGKLNAEGYIWIPQNSTLPWSTGVGIGTRVENAWFSWASGYDLPHGIYLEYQNGPGVGLSALSDSNRLARLATVNSVGAVGGSGSGYAVNYLGITSSPTPASWQPFRMFYDVPANKLFASLGGVILYDGPLPAGMQNVSGGFTAGFRENHSGDPSTAATEGTWIDNLTLNANTSTDSGVSDYYLY